MLKQKSWFTKLFAVLSATKGPYTPLDFSEINKRAQEFADLIEDRRDKLIDILLAYESYEVVHDEINRTLDLLRNIEENKKFFFLRIGEVTSFLPRNQPLYAFSCFVVIPSLMASAVYFRIPHSMRHFFSQMLELFNIKTLFPNIIISPKERLEFLKERSALKINPKSKESHPVTDVVIFTGIPAHADQLRNVFDKRTLFISNGSGHNPVIVSKDADLSSAVKAVITLQFYNQGQDCAAPNAILVHKDIFRDFIELLRIHIREIKIGDYRDKSCRVGPISDPKDLVRIQDFLVEHRLWLDPSTAGIIRTQNSIVEPTIISKPLIEGGNFKEIFAPLVFVQEYTDDQELKLYFENPHYAQNAMYLTLYGTSDYALSIVGKPIKNKTLHSQATFIHNTHLHAPGVERGTQPYGGYGHGASSLSIDGKVVAMPTLPQRDIYNYVAKPILKSKTLLKYKMDVEEFTSTQPKDVEKLLRVKATKPENIDGLHKYGDVVYADVNSVITKNARFVKIKAENLHYLLKERNDERIATLESDEIELLHKLKKLLNKKQDIGAEEFETTLYEIPKLIDLTKAQNILRQQYFFQNIYQLLFGTNFGPRLAPFLKELGKDDIDKFLNI